MNSLRTLVLLGIVLPGVMTTDFVDTSIATERDEFMWTVKEHQIEYGDPNYMVPFDPATYTGHTPWPDNKALGNNQTYYRMDYERLEDGIWLVSYPKKKKKLFLRATVIDGQPAGTWMYYYSNGNKMKQFLFEDGIWKGSYTAWYHKKQLMVEQFIDKTQETCGTRKVYDAKGNVISKTWLIRDVDILTRFFEKGELVKEAAHNQEYFAWRATNEAIRQEKAIKVIYKVYFGRYTEKVEAEEAEILLEMGTEKIEREDRRGTDYYIGGNFNTYDEALLKVDRLYQLGFPQAYVVAFIDGRRVGLDCVDD